MKLAIALYVNNRLKRLTFPLVYAEEITPLNSIMFWLCLGLNTTLRYIDLSSPHNSSLHPIEMKVLGEVLQNNKTLRYLHLRNHAIGTMGVTFLANGLKKNCHLHTLTLSNTRMCQNGLNAIADMLTVNKGLQHLSLGAITKEINLTPLFASLAKNKTLKTLEFKDALISKEAILALAKALPNNTTLEKLLIPVTNIEDPSLDQYALLSEYTNSNTQLTFCDAIASSPSLRVIDIRDPYRRLVISKDLRIAMILGIKNPKIKVIHR